VKGFAINTTHPILNHSAHNPEFIPYRLQSRL